MIYHSLGWAVNHVQQAVCTGQRQAHSPAYVVTVPALPSADEELFRTTAQLGAMLIPDPAVFHILSDGMTETDACLRYSVSPQMLRFRVNASGARIRMSRRQHQSLYRHVQHGRIFCHAGEEEF